MMITVIMLSVSTRCSSLISIPSSWCSSPTSLLFFWPFPGHQFGTCSCLLHWQPRPSDQRTNWPTDQRTNNRKWAIFWLISSSCLVFMVGSHLLVALYNRLLFYQPFDPLYWIDIKSTPGVCTTKPTECKVPIKQQSSAFSFVLCLKAEKKKVPKLDGFKSSFSSFLLELITIGALDNEPHHRNW